MTETEFDRLMAKIHDAYMRRMEKRLDAEYDPSLMGLLHEMDKDRADLWMELRRKATK